MVTDGEWAGEAVGFEAAKYGIAKHSLLIAGHRTSVSLEHAFWSALRLLAAERGLSVASLVATIDAGRGTANLSSTIRVYLLETYMALPRVGLP